MEIVRKDFPDRLTAIKKAEDSLFSTFVIDHTVTVEGGIFAIDGKGNRLKLYDDRIAIKHHDIYTVYALDISESRFIAELKSATLTALEEGKELRTFQIKGDSGTIYTYDATTLEVIGTEAAEPAKVDETVAESAEEKVVEISTEKLVDYVIAQRRFMQNEVTKAYSEKKVA